MATPEDRKKELRRNPTNYLARANMGKYRTYLRERLAKKGVDPNKVNIKQDKNKFVFVSPNNQKTIARVNIPAPVNEKKFVPSRAKGVDDTALINRIKTELASEKKSTTEPKIKKLTRKQLREMSPEERKAYNERQKKTPPASTPTVGGAKGRKERRGTTKRDDKGFSAGDALNVASWLIPTGIVFAGARILFKGGKFVSTSKTGKKYIIDPLSNAGKKIINAFKKKKAEKKADSPRDASAMKKSSKKKETSSKETKRNMDKSLFTKRKKEEKERVDDVRDIKKKTSGVTDKPSAGAKPQSMSQTKKPKVYRDKRFTKEANRARDKQSERTAQDRAYDRGANPKKALDQLIASRAKELGMTYNQLRYQVNKIFIRNKHQKIQTGGVKQKLHNVTSEQLKKGSPFMRDVKAYVDKVRSSPKYAKQSKGRTQAKLDLNKNKKETPPKKSLLKNKQEVFYAKLNKRFKTLVDEGRISPSERKLATQLRDKTKEILRNPNVSESAKQNAVQRYANQLDQIVKSTK